MTLFSLVKIMEDFYSTGNKIVDQVGKINFVGNIIPHTWYKTIVKENGKPNVNAIIILSDIVYWYRPKEVRDEYSGKLIGFEKKIKSDALQRSYEQIADLFGLSKRQAADAIVDLEKLGVIRRDFRVYDIYGNKLGSVLYILLDVQRLYELTFPIFEEIETPLLQNNAEGVTLKCNGGSQIMQGGSQNNVRGDTLKCDGGYRITQRGSQDNVRGGSLKRDPLTQNITKNTIDNTSEITATTEDEFWSVVEDAKDIFLDINIPKKDIPAIVKAANCDFAKMKKAADLLKAQTTRINNITGWVIKAIENDYEVKQKKMKNNFNNFKQHDYDFDELEKKMLNRF